MPAAARFAVFDVDGNVQVKLDGLTPVLLVPAVSKIIGLGGELYLGIRCRPLSGRRGADAAMHLCLLAPAACIGLVSF